MKEINRRNFLRTSAALSLGLSTSCISPDEKALFEISLAQWSLHRLLESRELSNLQFPEFTKKTFGIDAVEYVNGFFPNNTDTYLKDLKKRCDDHGVKSVLMMCDGLGDLGDQDKTKRRKVVENHFSWVESAKFLGCHSIRVNAKSTGSYDEQMNLAADGLTQLAIFAKTLKMNVIVENHGGLSSNGKWLESLMKKVDLENCGTLPDFGNFNDYDRYQGVRELMPYAKGVSAKSHEFDSRGREVHSDYEKMMKLVLDAGYRGYVGIEYEGNKHSEIEGIKLTRNLLRKIQQKQFKNYKS
ncbi:sugar phosphate isomerase/epimerase [Lentisphaera profundi]|uniref:Sugar phosphate isomerase/epimerase n=1 Tax=Lentisphaera profundi TaxID=1658616 RepID=A0ABY7VUI3_9BACT|nr:sugar phosphate isomerase/epimerase family protein [Lentisphaera profundi]WDE95773.1 sugar phosphate isomerase/epimerase [Lentisphaera profundi]